MTSRPSARCLKPTEINIVRFNLKFQHQVVKSRVVKDVYISLYSWATETHKAACRKVVLTGCVVHLDFSPQFARPQSLIGYGSRCDKLDQAETRSLLMCFLHIMKTISEGKKTWQQSRLQPLLASFPTLWKDTFPRNSPILSLSNNGRLTLCCKCNAPLGSTS